MPVGPNTEIIDQGKRAVVNLWLGAVSSIFGIILMFYLIRYAPNTGEWTQQFLWFFPRLSILLIIELIGYFFLRLYRAGLQEIKYFQNEMTNIDSKKLALFTALKFDDLEAIKCVIVELVKTERNFKLNKGESTVGIRLQELENEANRNAFGVLQEIRKELVPKKAANE